MLNYLYKVPLITRVKSSNGKVGRKYASFEPVSYTHLAQSNALGTVSPLFCTLKEQKEEERKGTSLTPFALTARQLVNYRLPMVLPWAIYLLGLRPVFARNRLLVYNVLKCYLAVFAPAITRNRLLVYNVLKCYLAVFASSLLETVYWCTMSCKIGSHAFSLQKMRS